MGAKGKGRQRARRLDGITDPMDASVNRLRSEEGDGRSEQAPGGGEGQGRPGLEVRGVAKSRTRLKGDWTTAAQNPYKICSKSAES